MRVLPLLSDTEMDSKQLTCLLMASKKRKLNW